MENDLVTENIPKLIKRIAIPASIGLFFHTMFNVTDTFFAGFISTQALAALTLSFPAFFIIIALGSGLSTGATALIANSLGANKIEDARQYAFHAILIAILLSVLITILGLIVSPFLFQLLGASGSYLALALSYMNIIFYGTIFFMLVCTFNSILNAVGNTKTFRNFLIVGFLLNLLLDPLFMFGWLGFPALGIRGIALATILVEAIGCFILGAKALKTSLVAPGLKLKKNCFIDISKQGVPSALNMATIGIGVLVITYFFNIFGKAAVAAYGIATRIEQIVLLPTIGLTIAALTLVGHNFGARNFDRIYEIRKKAIKYGIYIMTIGFLGIFIFPNFLMDIFTNDQEVIKVGIDYLRIAALITWAYALIFINISVLQGLKKPMYALWLGLFRQIIAPIIVFSILIYVSKLGIFGVFWGIFAIVWFSALITILYTNHVIKKLDIQ